MSRGTFLVSRRVPPVEQPPVLSSEMESGVANRWAGGFFPLTLVGDCFLLLPFVFLQHPRLGKNHLLI